MLDTIGGTLLILGATFVLLAGVGVLRLHDPLARMHAATKASTLGILLIALGAGLRLGDWAALVKLGVAVSLIFITAPVAAHLVGRAAYGADRDLSDALEIDELADRSAGREHNGGGA